MEIVLIKGEAAILSILDPLREFTLISIFLRLILGCLCGGIIGFERGHRGRAAGLRTHILVSLGACIVMITNQYLVLFMNPNADPARLGAQVISGIGFLGAGTIMITGRQITGLTTAAGLWTAACIGLACGIGFYEGAIIATLFILFTMTVLHNWEDRSSHIVTQVDLLVELGKSSDISHLLEGVKACGARIQDIEVSDDLKRVAKAGDVLVLLSLKVGRNFRSEELASYVSARADLITMKEI